MKLGSDFQLAGQFGKRGPADAAAIRRAAAKTRWRFETSATSINAEAIWEQKSSERGMNEEIVYCNRQFYFKLKVAIDNITSLCGSLRPTSADGDAGVSDASARPWQARTCHVNAKARHDHTQSSLGAIQSTSYAEPVF